MTENKVLSKPQFDTKMFEPGTAVRVEVSTKEQHSGWYRFKANCLVSDCTPLGVTLEFIETDKVYGFIGFDSKVLPVEMVDQNIASIEILRRA